MDKRTLALLAALGATTIYGLNHTIAKEVMPTYIQGFGFVQVRLLGAAILFWLVSLFIPQQKISRSDLPKMLLCALLGMVVNMLCFFKGIELSTPINSAVLITITPILVFVFSALLIKERLILPRILGVVLGFIGAFVLIVFGNEIRQDAPNIPLGNALFIVNASSFGMYLVLVKSLSAKYTTVHLLKWLFLFGFIMALPISFTEFSRVNWVTLPFEAIWRFAFVIIGTTFMTYLLNVYALKQLKASTVGVFTYLQPLIGIAYAIMVGADGLTASKLSAGSVVLLGVYLVTKRYDLKV
ncbi:MAG: EamA family transporter [Flavobacteriaceae bacterium]|jgi:drug/metabolite transporter (DMT)-like permease|nr:EamA family transporter [Flavobacteriaceae bacterium]MBJ33748.1 EamA family transporter [Flavobacteriaceae bacterium]|tara:strand:- start:5016 stop:5909 length:894 start_codon:yes stop_codon:yes gene_type:complete